MINPFADLLKDTIFIQSQSGKRQGPFKTNLRKERATIFASKLEVAPGDQLIRPIADDKEESYTILDLQFAEGMMDIPESYTFILSEECTLTTPPAARQVVQPETDKSPPGLDHVRSALEELTLAIDNSDHMP